MSAAVDPVAALRTMLLNDPDVAAAAGSRVYGGGLPAGVSPLNDGGCVVLKPAGGAGAGEAYMQWGVTRVDTYCYGSTLNQAWTVYLAVYGALKQMQPQIVDQVYLHAVSALSKGVQGIAPDTQFPVTLASWRVAAGEVAAA